MEQSALLTKLYKTINLNLSVIVILYSVMAKLSAYIVYAVHVNIHHIYTIKPFSCCTGCSNCRYKAAL